MKKRILSLLFMLCLIPLIAACGGGKYADCIKLNEEFLELMENYVTSIEKSDSAKEIAAAINCFADGMEVLGPKMKKMSKKYPELKDINNHPEELKSSQKKSEEIGKKFAGSFMKVVPYMKDPEVRAAQTRFSKAMQTMR